MLFIKPLITAHTPNNPSKYSPIEPIAEKTLAIGVNVSVILLFTFDRLSATFNQEPVVILIHQD